MYVKIFQTTLILVLGTLFLGETVWAKNKCQYELTASTGQQGSATVIIKKKKLRIIFEDVQENTLFTIWIDHKNRATGLLADDYPLDEGALERGVAPAIATTHGVINGMGLDKNGVITDGDGDEAFKVKLDYELLNAGASPVVGAGLSMQGLNRVGGNWLRKYDTDPEIGASLQLVDPNTGFPLLGRSTAQGITIVRHPDYITHGHTPGVGGVDHFSAFKGDFPLECLDD